MEEKPREIDLFHPFKFICYFLEAINSSVKIFLHKGNYIRIYLGRRRKLVVEF